MACALRGEADWDAVNLEDPLGAMDCVSGSMDDWGVPYEIDRETLRRELADIKRPELPHSAIESFVSVLAVRQTSRCAPRFAS